MLEASNNNQNGGIFSLPVDFSLLRSPTKGLKPTLIRKFGRWNTNSENFLKFPIYYSTNKGIIFGQEDVSIIF